MINLQTLGNVGIILLWILIGTLVVGLGILAWRSLGFDLTVMEGQKGKSPKQGGYNMPNNKWFKLALVSFVGIIISVFALGLLNTMNSGMGGNMNNATMQNTMPMGIGGMPGASMNMGTMPMGNTGMQMPMGTMPMGNAGMQMPMGATSMTSGFVPQTAGEAALLQQINTMQQEINNLKQMLNQMNTGGAGSSGGGGSMGGMSMM